MSESATITTHVLDLSRGQPAASVRVTLERRGASGVWETLVTAETNEDGRIAFWPGLSISLPAGSYQLRFATEAYFAGQGIDAFFTDVTIAFVVSGTGRHHVPLLLSPYGYSTYRGS